MGVGREAMQEVEIVDLGPGDALGPSDGVPAEDALDAPRRRRVAWARRTLRRWWPVPLALVLAVVAAQVVADAQERARVAERQQVDGVLHDVDADLTVVPMAEDLYRASMRTTDGLTIAAVPPDGSNGRALAGTRDGTTVWTHAFDPAGTVASLSGFDAPACYPADEPLTEVVCLVVDREIEDQGNDSWQLGPQTAATLVRLDAATGTEVDRTGLPALSGMTVQDDVLYLASVPDAAGVLEVTAQGAATGVDLWRTVTGLPERWTAYDFSEPSVRLVQDRLVVQSITASAVLDPVDGTLEYQGTYSVDVSRTGLLTTSIGTTRFLAADGSELYATTGSPAWFGVDDGSVPDLELMVDGHDLVALDPRAGQEVWRSERDGWSGSTLILLDGTVYGADSEQVWALDAATGRELWTATLPGTSDGTLLTDGRCLLVGAQLEQRATEVPDDPTTEHVAGLLAYRLGDGTLAWSTPLPDGITQVWHWEHDLIGFDGTSATSYLR
jgi:outer membrane protein assembly factor BamB